MAVRSKECGCARNKTPGHDAVVFHFVKIARKRMLPVLRIDMVVKGFNGTLMGKNPVRPPVGVGLEFFPVGIRFPVFFRGNQFVEFQQRVFINVRIHIKTGFHGKTTVVSNDRRTPPCR